MFEVHISASPSVIRAAWLSASPSSAKPGLRRYRAAAHSTLLVPTLSYVATSIPYFISFEVRAAYAPCRFGFPATLGQLAFVTVFRMEAVIYVALEFTGAMEPRACANEGVPAKPFWTVVACRGTVIWSDVIVTIGTFRSCSDVDADLSLCFWGGSGQADSSNSSYHEKCNSTHKFTSQLLKHFPRRLSSRRRFTTTYRSGSKSGPRVGPPPGLHIRGP